MKKRKRKSPCLSAKQASLPVGRKHCTYDPTLVKGVVLSKCENAQEVGRPYAIRAGVTV